MTLASELEYVGLSRGFDGSQWSGVGFFGVNASPRTPACRSWGGCEGYGCAPVPLILGREASWKNFGALSTI